MEAYSEVHMHSKSIRLFYTKASEIARKLKNNLGTSQPTLYSVFILLFAWVSAGPLGGKLAHVLG